VQLEHTEMLTINLNEDAHRWAQHKGKTMDNYYYLNADEINEFDNIVADRMALEQTLKIALQHHANRMSELELSSKKLWRDVHTKMGLGENEALEKKIITSLSKRNGQVVAIVTEAYGKEIKNPAAK